MGSYLQGLVSYSVQPSYHLIHRLGFNHLQLLRRITHIVLAPVLPLRVRRRRHDAGAAAAGFGAGIVRRVVRRVVGVVVARIAARASEGLADIARLVI